MTLHSSYYQGQQAFVEGVGMVSDGLAHMMEMRGVGRLHVTLSVLGGRGCGVKAHK